MVERNATIFEDRLFFLSMRGHRKENVSLALLSYPDTLISPDTFFQWFFFIFSIICHGPWTNSSRKAESLFTKRFHLGATCKRGNFLSPFSCINILNFIQYFFFSGFDLVINCTGMGAQKLCHDSNMSPVRGQVIRVKAPWQKFCVFADNDTYVIPGTFSLNNFYACSFPPASSTVF